MFDKFRLPTNMEIGGNVYEFHSDYRKIIQCMEPLNDPNLLDEEKIYCCSFLFFKEYDKIPIEDRFDCTKAMFEFITGGEDSRSQKGVEKPLYDWNKDFTLIASAINTNIKTDIRSMDYLHWWTFLSYFMEIGECTFSTYVGIRDKKNRGIKLEKHEERIFRENKDAIEIKKKYDSVMEEEIARILGKR